MNRLVVETTVDAPVEAVFEAVQDIEALGAEIPAFQRVEVRERDENGYVATMHEEYGGREVVITSRFAWSRPQWVSYEHVDGPFGVNRGRFVLEPLAAGTLLRHEHETEQDISDGTKLRDDWLALMAEQHAAIGRLARAGSG